MKSEDPVNLATPKIKLACFNLGREVIPPAFSFRGGTQVIAPTLQDQSPFLE